MNETPETNSATSETALFKSRSDEYCKMHQEWWEEFNKGHIPEATSIAYRAAADAIENKDVLQARQFEALSHLLGNRFVDACNYLRMCFESILKLDPQDVYPIHLRACDDYLHALLESRNYLEAYAALADLRNFYGFVDRPPSIKFVIRSAAICRALDRRKESKDLLDEFNETYGDHVDYLSHRAFDFWEDFLLSDEDDPYRAECIKLLEDNFSRQISKYDNGGMDNALLWNNKAVLSYIKTAYPEAEVSLLKAIAIDETDPIFHFNLGLAKYRQYDNESAEQCFKEARRLWQIGQKVAYARNSELFENVCRIRKQDPVSDIEEKEFLEFLLDICDRIDNAENFFIERFSADTYLQESLLIANTREEHEDSLVVLKGWQAKYPPFKRASLSTGGGYYLRWEGTGIVIDPGYHYVRHMIHHGIPLQDINAIVLTGPTLDHCYDIERILLLMRSINDLRRARASGSEAIDPLVKQMLPQNDLSVDVFLSQTAMAKYGELLKGYYQDVVRSVNEYGQTDETVQYQRITDQGDRHVFNLNPIMFGNGDGAALPVHQGFVLELPVGGQATPPIRLGYTSDTRWGNGYEITCEDCDVIIGHLGQIQAKEFSAEGVRDEKLSTEHLGLYGCFRLIRNKHPKVFILGALGPELSRYKGKLVAEFNKRFWSATAAQSTKVISGKLGMVLNLKTNIVNVGDGEVATNYADVRERYDAQQGRYRYV